MIPGAVLYQVFYKTMAAPDTAEKSVAWVRATSEADAERRVAENLDSSYYEVTGAVHNPEEWRIQKNDITIGFRHPYA